MNLLHATDFLPTAKTFADYEKLSVVGILLLVLFVGLLVSNRIFGWVKEYGLKVLDQLNKQTMALENVKQSNASMELGQSRLHARLDDLLRCPARPCPLRPTDHVVMPRGPLPYAAPFENSQANHPTT